MLKDLIIQKLESLGNNYKVNGDWVSCECQHNDAKHGNPYIGEAGINIETGIHSCFKDHDHSFQFITQDDSDEEDIEELLWKAKYNTLRSGEAQDEVFLGEFTLPPFGHKIEDAWRCIEVDILQELGVYYCNAGRYTGRYIFPIYIDGKCVGFDARIVDDTAKMQNVKWVRPKGMEAQAITYPIDKLITMGKDYIVITEGVMDAISYIQMGVPAIPSFGVSPPSMHRIEQLISLGVSSVTIAFDNDDAGIQGTINVAPYYAKWFDMVPNQMVNMVRNSRFKDANEFLVDIKSNGIVKKESQSWDNEDF